VLGVIRWEWRLSAWRSTRPNRVSVDGVDLELDDSWATPSVREGIYTGSYEAPERRVLRRTLRPDDRYMELGAGIGLLITCACRVVGADNVVGYEANPDLARVARETARRNAFDAKIVNAVLGERSGETDFYVRREFWDSSLRPSSDAKQIRVPLRSFGGALADFRPTYLMLDIEGGEIDLLTHPLPATVRAVCVEVHPAVVSDGAIDDLVVKLIADGFSLIFSESDGVTAFFERRAASRATGPTVSANSSSQ